MSGNDISLSAAIRTNLISLQGTQNSINFTQNALSTGNKVNSAIDNPVAYFQSQALSDRASDFSEKKGAIDQSISSLSTALEGVSGIQSLVQQLKGLALNSQSATSSQISGLVAQFNGLRDQINTLAQDTTYNGLNLIAASGQILTVSFSTVTGSNLIVKSVDVTSGPQGLAIAKAITANGFSIDFDSNAGINLSDLSAQTVLWAGTGATLASGVYTFGYGSATLTVNVGSAGSLSSSFTTTSTFTQGGAITLQFLVTGAAGATIQNGQTIGVEYGSGQTIIDYNAFASATLGNILTVDFNGLTGTTLNSGTYTFSYGGQIVSFSVNSAGSTTGTYSTSATFTNGNPITFTLTSGTVLTGSDLVLVPIRVGGITNDTKFAVSNQSSSVIVTSGQTFSIELQGLTGDGLNSGIFTFDYGTQTLSFTVGSAGGSTGATFTTTQTFTNGGAVTVTLGAAGAGGATSANYINGSGVTLLGGQQQNANLFQVEYTSGTVAVATGNTFVIGINGLTGSTLLSGAYTFSYGGQILSFKVGSALTTSATFSSTQAFSNGAALTLTFAFTATLSGNQVYGNISGQGYSLNLEKQTIGTVKDQLSGYSIFTLGQRLFSNTGIGIGVTVASAGTLSVSQVTGQYVLDANVVPSVIALISKLDTALANLRTQAQTIGSNVALLNTRLDFTTTYINVLTSGSGKLTLADLNEEGANLLSLQTRQSLGIQALSFAGQSERAVLQLFR